MEAKMWKNSGWVEITDPFELRRVCNQVLKDAGFGVLSFVEYGFEPFGYTALWLLSESHFALHTFPEKGLTYFELSSCIEDKYENFLQAFTLQQVENGN